MKITTTSMTIATATTTATATSTSNHGDKMNDAGDYDDGDKSVNYEKKQKHLRALETLKAQGIEFVSFSGTDGYEHAGGQDGVHGPRRGSRVRTLADRGARKSRPAESPCEGQAARLAKSNRGCSKD
jgi:hypothetical protein